MQELPYEIIQRAIHGPPQEAATRQAFERVYLHYDRDIRKVVRCVAAWKSHDAEDLCQEVWCNLLGNGRRRLQAFDPNRRVGFSKFLKRVALFEALGLLRLRRNKKVGSGAPLDPVDELVDERTTAFVLDVIQRDELEKLIDAAAKELGPDYRVVLVEVLIRERSCAEVARELGEKENTISARKHRAKKKLKQILDKLRGKPPQRSSYNETHASVMTKALLLVLMVIGG